MSKDNPQSGIPQPKSFNDFYAAVDFYPEADKRPLADIVGKQLMLLDCHIVKGFKSKFGESDFALLYLQDTKTQEEFTTLCGGEVVVKKVSDAKKENLLPLLATIVKEKHYYDIQ